MGGTPRTFDRRTGEAPDTHERRRSEDYADVQRELGKLAGAVEDLENRADVIDGRGLPGDGRGLLERMAKLEGRLDEIATNVAALLTLTQGIDGKADRLASLKSWTLAILGLLVPILVAVVTGYFALKANAPQALPK